ncbi:hypothetical protein Taro_023425, partial [Colocasia esculenta]|nr:hypothetical protein [Colocasia esculenta]
MIYVCIVVCVLPSFVVRHLFRNISAVRYPRFCVSQARVFVVLGVCSGTCVVPSRSVSPILDTLTLVFELYVRLRKRRQRAATCVCGCAVACSALVVGGTDTSSRHWSPTSPVFQCLTLGSLGQSPKRCQAWACRVCDLQEWCLVGLHSCLTFSRGAAAGPFVRCCETERQTCVCLSESVTGVANQSTRQM